MTTAATPEALEQALADWILKRWPTTQWQAAARAKAILAGPLAPVLATLQRQVEAINDLEKNVNGLEAALQRVTAERDEYAETLMQVAEVGGWQASAGLAHEVRSALATAAAEAASLRAEVEAKDRAILLLLPFVDYAAGEGLMFVETEDGEHPEMDAADIMAAVAEALGLELGSDAYLSLLPKGYAEIRAALTRAATAGEG